MSKDTRVKKLTRRLVVGIGCLLFLGLLGLILIVLPIMAEAKGTIEHWWILPLSIVGVVTIVLIVLGIIHWAWSRE